MISPMYEILLTERAQRDMDRLDSQTRQRLTQKLHEYAEYPMQHAKKLSNPVIGSFRFRVGDWRIVFDVEGDKIVVLRVGNRRDIYR